MKTLQLHKFNIFATSFVDVFLCVFVFDQYLRKIVSLFIILLPCACVALCTSVRCFFFPH